MTRITYFANDLTDPAVARRVRMLRIGGADVRVLGFRRSEAPVQQVNGVPAVDLGRTYDQKLVARSLSVVQQSTMAWRWKHAIAGADVLLARNLEMAIIADAVRIWARSSVSLAYECLDIHSALLGTGMPARVLRRWERWILQRSSHLIVSSPAFLTRYFNQLPGRLPAVILAENKRVLDEPLTRPARTTERRPPWRIGWFANLRCTQGFNILLETAKRYPDLVDIELRGRPVESVSELIKAHLPRPNMRFGGPYKQSDLAAMYAACDFAWSVELYHRNAYWALSNRLYEAGSYNVPLIALSGQEMAAWLTARRIGLVLEDTDSLGPSLHRLTTAEYAKLQNASLAVPVDDLIWTPDDCCAFVQRLTHDNGKR